MRRVLMTISAAALLAGAAAPALAAGGPGGGGGGGGGGGNGGPPSTAPCVTFQSATAPVGPGAVFNDYTIHNCGKRVADVNVFVSDADCATGLAAFIGGRNQPLAENQSASAVLEFVPAPPGTTYCITYTIKDVVTGVQLDRATLSATTPLI